MIYLVIAAAIVVADQITKYFATQHLIGIGEVEMIPGFLHLTYRLNEGATLGLLTGVRWVLVLLPAVATVVLLVVLFSKRLDMPKSERFALAAILGGAVGNLIDRVFNAGGGVVDMLYFPWIGKLPLLPDFVCNLADFGVVFGAAVFIILYSRRHIAAEKLAKINDQNDG